MDFDRKTALKTNLRISKGFDLSSIEADIESIKNSICNSCSSVPEIHTHKEWHYIAEKYAFLGFLINGNIILYWVKGEVKKKDVAEVFERMKAIAAAADQSQPLYQILDLSHITAFSLSARKAYENVSSALFHYWQQSFYVMSGFGNTIFKLYSALSPEFLKNATLTKSLDAAISSCLQERNTYPKNKENQHSFDPTTASHKDLLKAYQQLSEKHEALSQTHKNIAQQLLREIGKITWEEDFVPKEIEHNFISDFDNVFGALNLLQYDLQEIFNRQKQLNALLEKEVATRTYQLSSVIENTSEMILSVDKNWRVQVINSAFRNYFRRVYNTSLQSGDFLLAKYPKHTRNTWQSRFLSAFEGQIYSEQITETVDNEKRYLQLTFNPIHEAYGVVKEVSLFVQDITSLKKAEEKAKEYENNLLNALKIAKAGSWEFDLKSGKIKIGVEGLHLLGYQAEQEMIISFEEFTKQFLPAEDTKMLQERFAIARENIGNPDFYDQFPYRLYSNERKLLQFMLYSRFKSNEPTVIFGISQDITAQKESEEKLLRQNAALKKVNSELDQFVYSVSHDLRAPLSSVLGLINIARQEEDMSTVMHYLDLQEKSILKLDVFIREIMDLSRNARLSLQKDKIIFKELVDEVFEEQQYDQSTARIEKMFRIQQNEDFYSDTKRIRVILRNLISNALRYANLNQENPYVIVDVQVSQKVVILEIEDNGVGISEEHQPHIYEMFYRANQSKSGSGLGLYIVKETIDKLNGTVELSSELGKMTKFKVNLPSLA